MNCEGEHDIMWMNFNQDGTSLSAGAKAGFYLYGLNNATEKLDVRQILYLNQNSFTKKIRKIQDHFDESAQDIILVERLFNSSLVVTVSRENARKIRVYHFRKVYLLTCRFPHVDKRSVPTTRHGGALSALNSDCEAHRDRRIKR